MSTAPSDVIPPGFDPHGNGLITLSGTIPALCQALDDRLRTAMTAAGAVELRFPTLIARSVLQRAGYFESFDGAETAVEDGTYVLQPAACYHCYPHLSEQQVDRVAIICAGRCYRRGEIRFVGATRLWEFTMRELVFVGDSQWVREQCQTWADHALLLARELGIDASCVPATDSFIGFGARGRRLLQQVKQSKHEIRAESGPGDIVALASTNLHGTFFSERFAVRTRDGRPAHSACVAFGIERWAASLMWQRGESAAAALVSPR